jgi:hypothetical protein
MALDVSPYAHSLAEVAQTLASFEVEAGWLRSNPGLSPDVLRRRLAQLLETTRQMVIKDFSVMIDQVAQHVTQLEQVTPIEPDLDVSDWVARVYWRSRYATELLDLDETQLWDLVEEVAARGQVAQRLELYDLAERRYRDLGSTQGLSRLHALIEAGITPDERDRVSTLQVARELHSFCLRNGSSP